MAREAMLCLQVLKESNKSKFDSYSVINSVSSISHIFRDCRVYIFSQHPFSNQLYKRDLHILQLYRFNLLIHETINQCSPQVTFNHQQNVVLLKLFQSILLKSCSVPICSSLRAPVLSCAHLFPSAYYAGYICSQQQKVVCLFLENSASRHLTRSSQSIKIDVDKNRKEEIFVN